MLVNALESGAELGECVTIIEAELAKRELPGDVRRANRQVCVRALASLGEPLSITRSPRYRTCLFCSSLEHPWLLQYVFLTRAVTQVIIHLMPHVSHGRSLVCLCV